MAVLKKVKSSTLMETMVATVLIVIIFMVASLVMNALMAAKSQNNIQPLRERLHQLEYLYIAERLELPYFENWRDWEIAIKQENDQPQEVIHLSASKEATNQQFETYIVTTP